MTRADVLGAFVCPSSSGALHCLRRALALGFLGRLVSMAASLTPAQIDAHLVRIGLDPAEVRASPVDKHLLARIHLAHVTTVPFENLRTHLRDVTLSAPDVPIIWRCVGSQQLC